MISILLYGSDFWTNEEKTGGVKNVVLQKYTENSINEEIKQIGSLKENSNRKHTHTRKQEKTTGIAWTYDHETELAKLNPHGAF